MHVPDVSREGVERVRGRVRGVRGGDGRATRRREGERGRLGARARWEEAEGAECERGEAVFGRAVRREIGRGWNAGVDAVFGAGVRALSERRL